MKNPWNNYKEVIEEWKLHIKTKHLAEEAEEHYELWHNVKTLINQIKEKLILINKEQWLKQ